MIGLLASPLARYAAVACAFAIVAGWAWAERAGRMSAVERAMVAEAAATARDRAIAALEAEAEAARARAARFSNIRDRINAAPTSTACAASEPVRAALDGLRASAPGRAGAAVTTGLRDRTDRP
jgi:hypothetical protein